MSNCGCDEGGNKYTDLVPTEEMKSRGPVLTDIRDELGVVHIRKTEVLGGKTGSIAKLD